MAELTEANNIYGLEYKWKLTGLRKVNSNGLDGIVIGTNWTLTGIDEDGYEGTFTGATPFKTEELNVDAFTPFSSLTEEGVLSWVKNVVYSQPSYWEHINTQILKAIRDNKSPVDILFEADLPWSPTSGSTTPMEMITGSEGGGEYTSASAGGY
jgi:hypothetical protein